MPDLRLLALAALTVLTGCDLGAAPQPTGDAPTWHADVRPIFERRCGGCHVEGGIAPIAFDDPADWADGAPAWASLAAHAVEAGTMPPWPPAQDCQPLKDARVLEADEKATIAAWAAAEFPVGEPSAYVPPPHDPTVDDLGEPDLTLAPAEPYHADTSSTDDWRCFVVDHDFPVDAWVRAFDVAPDRLDLVHHVILYRLGAEYADDVAAWDAADEGAGYTCFGSPGTWDADNLAGWAPGQRPEVYEPGVARRIEAGSKLVLQVHYNTANAQGEVATDQSAVKLWLLPDGQQPTWQLYSIPLADSSLLLKAGDEHAVAQRTWDMADLLPIELEVIGVALHMHQLGSRIALNLRRAGQEEAQCVARIDEWDFHWQGSYFFPTDQTLRIGPTDEVSLKCVYDNSAANQPLVDGAQQPPRDVRWGESTFDEMCLAYAHVLVPPGFL